MSTTNPFSRFPGQARRPDPPSQPEKHRALVRAALRSGFPVFLELTDGSVLGFEPYPCEALAAIGRWNPGGPLLGRCTAQQLARVTVTSAVEGASAFAILESYVDVDALWFFEPDEISFYQIELARTANAAFTKLDFGYRTELAARWADAFRHDSGDERSVLDGVFAGETAYLDVRTVAGDLYACRRTDDGTIDVVDLTASAAADRIERYRGDLLTLGARNGLTLSAAGTPILSIETVSEVSWSTGTRSERPLALVCETYVANFAGSRAIQLHIDGRR